LPAAAGVAAVLLGVGAGSLTAVLVARAFSPKEAVIGLFGSHDKAFLFVVLAIVVGVRRLRRGARGSRAWLGRALVLAGAALGVAAALTRGDSTPLSAAPAVVTGLVAAWALAFLVRWTPGLEPAAAPLSRRSFLTWSAAAASLAVPGISSVVTPVGKFYRTDIELVIPQLDPAQWSLTVHGMVERPFTLSWDELVALPMEEHYVTLACVSNEVGGPLIGTAKWLGYPVRLLLERAAVKSGADMVYSESFDGYTAATPLSAMTEPGRAALLAIGMNGAPLTFVHGYPARLVVPGLYGYVSAPKWVVDLKVTRFAEHQGYWARQGWAQKAPIKQSSRIDVPRPGPTLTAGRQWVAGVAWDQHVSIAKVEVQVDDGPWREAQLARAINADTWVQWRWSWDAAPGDHQLRVRTTNARGVRQTSGVSNVLPDGATGWHTIEVSVA
jgi:DMSO/TMAO reductase YedYZ molybdopterin-dependent catalytic subunit